MTWMANQNDYDNGWADWYGYGVSPRLACVAYRGTEYAVLAIAGMREPMHPITIWWSVLFYPLNAGPL
jgi:hypothetical protein